MTSQWVMVFLWGKNLSVLHCAVLNIMSVVGAKALIVVCYRMSALLMLLICNFFS